MRDLTNINWDEEDDDVENEKDIEFSLNAQNGIEIKNEKYFIYSCNVGKKNYNFAIFTKNEHPRIPTGGLDKNFFIFYLSAFIEVEKNQKLMPIDIQLTHLPIETTVVAKNFDQAECELFDAAYSLINSDGINFSVSKAYTRESLLDESRINVSPQVKSFIDNQDLNGFVNQCRIEYADKIDEDNPEENTKVLSKLYQKLVKKQEDITNVKKKKGTEQGQISLFC